MSGEAGYLGAVLGLEQLWRHCPLVLRASGLRDVV